MIKIKVIKDQKINYIFVKANKYLVDNFEEDFNRSNNKNQTLRELYRKHFKAYLHENKENFFDEIIFEKEKDYTMFLLKFE